MAQKLIRLMRVILSIQLQLMMLKNGIESIIKMKMLYVIINLKIAKMIVYVNQIKTQEVLKKIILTVIMRVVIPFLYHRIIY